MDSLTHLMNKHKRQKPSQVRALKLYAKETHDIDISVSVTAKNYIIKIPNAAAANQFRFEKQDIVDTCKLDKPLIIQVGY